MISQIKFDQMMEYAKSNVSTAWDASQWPAFNWIITEESGWNPRAVNPESGACGLAQNINCSYSLDNADGQISWAIRYIKSRYGTPERAKAFHLAKGFY